MREYHVVGSSNGDASAADKYLIDGCMSRVGEKFSPKLGTRIDIPRGEMQRVRLHVRDKGRNTKKSGFSIHSDLLTFSWCALFSMALVVALPAAAAKTVSGILGFGTALWFFIHAVKRGAAGRKFFENCDISCYEFEINDIVKLSIRGARYTSVLYFAEFGGNYLIIGRNDYDRDRYRIGDTLACFTAEYNGRLFFMLTVPQKFEN